MELDTTDGKFRMNGFEGTQYRLVNNWFKLLDPMYVKDCSLNYLEIGTLCGANLISFGLTYGQHPDTKMYCIDPWENYDEYDEYRDQNKQNIHYEIFNRNLNKCDFKDRVTVHRGYSHKVLPTLEDEFFNIIYIDGNHEPEYVLEDAVLSFRKLIKNGLLIFDDYHNNQPELTKRGVDAFLEAYKNRIHNISYYNGQLFLQKK